MVDGKGHIAPLVLGLIASQMSYLLDMGIVYVLDSPLYKQGDKYIYQDNIDEDDATQTYFNLIEKYGGSNNFKKYLISNGYDSIIVHNRTANYYENDTYTIIVVFNPNDIKIINTIKYNV
jgi:DNA gyrase/topoisomerase IV subunit B